MSDNPNLKLVAATFADESGAGKALATVVPTLGKAIGMAAVVAKLDDGKVKWIETHDSTTGQGAFKGAGLGAVTGLLGILFTPVALLGAPVGAAVGAIVGKLRDTGFEDDDLKAIGADLPAGSSALVATIDTGSMTQARSLLEAAGAKTVLEREVSAELAELLDQEAAASTPA